MNKPDYRVELFKNGEPCGEILRFGNRIIRNTVEHLPRDVAIALSSAMSMPAGAATAVIAAGARYTWKITTPTLDQIEKL